MREETDHLSGSIILLATNEENYPLGSNCRAAGDLLVLPVHCCPFASSLPLQRYQTFITFDTLTHHSNPYHPWNHQHQSHFYPYTIPALFQDDERGESAMRLSVPLNLSMLHPDSPATVAHSLALARLTCEHLLILANLQRERYVPEPFARDWILMIAQQDLPCEAVRASRAL